MRQTFALIVAAIFGLSACAQRISEEDSGGIEAMRWRATLAATPSGGGIAGSLMVEPAQNPTLTSARMMLTNGAPNATYPWHIHAGLCGTGGGIVGPPDAYRPLTTGASGNAEATVTLPFSTPTVGTFSVNIHRSPTEMGDIVACGNLTHGSVSP